MSLSVNSREGIKLMDFIYGVYVSCSSEVDVFRESCADDFVGG